MFKRLADGLIFTNIYVALPIVSLVIQTVVINDININFWYITQLYFATLFTYNAHRLRGLEHMLKNDVAKRHLWSRKNKVWLKIILVFSVIVITVSALKMELSYYFYVLPLIALVAGYIFPIFKLNKRWFRLRDIPFLKAILIAFAVAYLTWYIPVSYFGKMPFSFLGFFERFFFIVAITIPFDIRDKTFDSHSKLKTFPTVFGINKAKAISVFLLSLSAVFFLLNYNYSVKLVLAETVFVIITGLIIYNSNQNKSEYFYSFLLEGTMILQSGLVIVAYFLAR